MHRMECVKQDKAGMKLWHCTQCSYKLLIGIAPFRRIVVEEGEYFAQHFGSTGNIQMIAEVEPTPSEFDRDFLNGIGIII